MVTAGLSARAGVAMPAGEPCLVCGNSLFGAVEGCGRLACCACCVPHRRALEVRARVRYAGAVSRSGRLWAEAERRADGLVRVSLLYRGVLTWSAWGTEAEAAAFGQGAEALAKLLASVGEGRGL